MTIDTFQFSRKPKIFAEEFKNLIIPDLPRHPYELTRIMYDTLSKVKAHIVSGSYSPDGPIIDAKTIARSVSQASTRIIYVKKEVAGLIHKFSKEDTSQNPEVQILLIAQALFSAISNQSIKHKNEDSGIQLTTIKSQPIFYMLSESNNDENSFENRCKQIREVVSLFQQSKPRDLSSTKIAASLDMLPSIDAAFNFDWKECQKLIGVSKEEIVRIIKYWRPQMKSKQKNHKSIIPKARRVTKGKANTSSSKRIKQDLGEAK